MEILSRVARHIQETADLKHDKHLFYMFEPWDVAKRSEDIKRKAIEDDAQIYNDEFLGVFGTDPHPFQTGYFQSTKKIRLLIAGSSTGKSICPLIETGIMISGEIPYAFRYENGVDTGVPRVISKENIRRFGRRDSSTGTVIDYRVNHRQSSSWQEWNCGNVIGAGRYPQEKISESGKQIWIATVAESIKKFWWPMLANPDTRVLPDAFIDTSKGNNGYNISTNTIHCIRGMTIFILSFEQGHMKLESVRAHAIVEDEETTTPDLFASAQEHAPDGYVTIAMTPLKGITWSRELVFNKGIDADRFHACQYDSPYQNAKEIDRRRTTYPKWIRQSRCWGLYSEQSGEPYFNRAKINVWLQNYSMHYDLVSFAPKAQWFTMRGNPRISALPGLIDTEVHKYPAPDTEEATTAWRMYEDRLPGVGYILAADAAEGAEIPEEAGNMNAAIVMRMPLESEEHAKLVCSIRSTLPTKAFAKVCAFALRYYNNAMLAAESGQGAENKAFELEVEDWPYWYMSTVTRDATGTPRQKRGFVMKSNQRQAIFKEIEEYIGEFDEGEYPHIPDKPLLKELAAAVKGKKGRCDHVKRGSLDTSICFGILLHVIKHDSDQIKCNYIPMPKQNNRRNPHTQRSAVPCGLQMLGMKESINGNP